MTTLQEIFQQGIDAKSALGYLLYLLAAVLFIVGLMRLSKVRKARSGNTISSVGMLIAVVVTLWLSTDIGWAWIAGGFAVGAVIGLIAAVRVAMTSMPEMVALFNGFGGLASMVVALSYYWLHVIEEPVPMAGAAAAGVTGAAGLSTAQLVGASSAVTLILSVIIGGLTFTGSIVAYLKLSERISGAPVLLPGRHVVNAILVAGSLIVGVWMVFSGSLSGQPGIWVLVGVTLAALVLGVMLVIPIGGADMPVVISLLNSYSGMAAAATGFVLNNWMLIVAGALVGSSGLILTKIMCVAMNRSLANVLFGGFGAVEAGAAGGGEYVGVKSAGIEEAAMILEAAESVIIVPGYGLAVAQAQHAAKELGNLLEKRGCLVRYAIHPVAGRMPGHMNVLLAEADVAYEKLVEMDQINPEFKNTDVAIVVGANDVVNPLAETDPKSPIAGMPILKAYDARTVFVIKRSLNPGFAGIKNELFERDNTLMVYGDAKKVLQGMSAELIESAKAA